MFCGVKPQEIVSAVLRMGCDNRVSGACVRWRKGSSVLSAADVLAVFRAFSSLGI
jgi:hypothetical protein